MLIYYSSAYAKKPKSTSNDVKNMPRITSRVTKATTKAAYLRTSVPQEIKEYLELELGDVLEWIPSEKDGRKVVVIRKLE